jgi:hypothetical protein
MPTIEELKKFLLEANQHTYADADAPKTASLRPSSHDYHFEEGDFVYHDTYFGGKQFLGEEIVYWKGKPFWGMNYYGRGLLEHMPESYFDEILRPALMAAPWPEFPVRGPERFVKGEYEYALKRLEGDMAAFAAKETISQGGTIIFETFLHGGLIQ